MILCFFVPGSFSHVTVEVPVCSSSSSRIRFVYNTQDDMFGPTCAFGPGWWIGNIVLESDSSSCGTGKKGKSGKSASASASASASESAKSTKCTSKGKGKKKSQKSVVAPASASPTTTSSATITATIAAVSMVIAASIGLAVVRRRSKATHMDEIYENAATEAPNQSAPDVARVKTVEL